jgi:hypothetical protein
MAWLGNGPDCEGAIPAAHNDGRAVRADTDVADGGFLVAARVLKNLDERDVAAARNGGYGRRPVQYLRYLLGSDLK